MRFLHCSDIHLLDLSGVGPLRFLNKRLTGGVNLALKRRKLHNDALFDRMIEQARALSVDRMVITGDLTNLALESEFELVQQRLRSAQLEITVIPGNHDAYTRGSTRSRRFEHYLREFMEGERDPRGGDYPFVQRFGDVALIGVSTAVATLPLYATGVVGDEQLARLDRVFADLAAKSVFRIVLIHHPVMPGAAKKRHDLLDLEAFGAVIRRHGAELILHGHEHRRIEGFIPGPGAPVPVHGIASGTCLSERPGREGAFSVYEIADGAANRTDFCWSGGDFQKQA